MKNYKSSIWIIQNSTPSLVRKLCRTIK